MRNAMKKFVAVVLSVAMLLSMAVPVFAGQATPTPSGPIGTTPTSTRDPGADVSLRIHHFDIRDGDIDPGVHPGHSLLNPHPFPAGEPDLVYGSMWRMQQVQGPANWAGDTVPSAVINHLLDPVANPATTLPDGWAVMSAPVTRWQRAAANQHQAPVLVPGQNIVDAGNAGTPVPALFTQASGVPAAGAVGLAEAVTGFSPVTNAAGPTPTPRPVQSATFNPAQGMWVVWEVYQDGGPHTANQYSTIRAPFVVNLPTFVHHPDPGSGWQPYTPLPGHTPPPAPGTWIYNVNVYPKPPEPPIVGKDYVGSHPVGGDNEHTIITWRMRMGINNDIVNYVGERTTPVPTAVPAPRHGTHGLDYPVNNPAAGTGANLPASLVGAAGVTSAGVDSFAVMRDTLDFRTHLVGVPKFNPVGGAANNGIVADPPAHFIVNFDNVNGGLTPLPRMSGTYVNWVLVTHTYVINPTTPAAGIPVPGIAGNVVYSPALTAAGAAATPPVVVCQSIQVFWVHLTAHGLNYVATGGPAGSPNPALSGRLFDSDVSTDHGFIRVQFDVRASLIYADHNATGLPNTHVIQHGPINNDMTLYFGRNPGVDAGDTGDDDRTDLAGIKIRKMNPDNLPLCGAVFYLFRADQMLPDRSGPRQVTQADIDAGLNNGVLLNGYHIPIRRVITGDYTAVITAARAPSPAYPPGSTTNDAAQRALLSVGQEAGQGIFTGLPLGIYYLYELQAPPGGYRRITTYTQVVLGIYTPGAGGAPGTWAPYVNQTAAGNNFTLTLNVTNTRDFELPLTGGAGTIMFTAAGVSLMGGAGLFLFLAKKKERVQK